MKKVEELLSKVGGKGRFYQPPTLNGALKVDPALTWRSSPFRASTRRISRRLPGSKHQRHAVFGQRTIEEEKALKTYAYDTSCW
jgi:hypothetical protein